MLRDQIGMSTQAVACAFDLNDDRMVKQPIEQSSCDDRVAEHIAPLGNAAVRCQDHGSLLVSGVDQLEEQIGPACCDGQVANLVDNEQGCPCIEPDLLDQAAFAFGFGQSLDQFCQRAAIDAFPSFDRSDAKRGGKVGLAGAWAPR